ncbi:response regulator transcription factor [Caminibacter pacificus]|jgi:DNA-binding response OmpR family regulator|uniref:DNA-binding response OmpR family regulator n=1 Tax=Caminibacter pacificus TaxID=1424653 RepID=A0AAJ4RBK0_9BACT|nr:response regulator transcription factor [Caminibacter pacificus]NPA88255.1 response regulator transcription factor [Campylobacterota bacterium]QCI27511.1 response regulator transcription factor [Caminibacter pacificus]ROR38950.1 DNA-binding response OmpR family regulator [Caminibacter pacificus]
MHSVLLIEDDPQHAKIVKRILEHKDFQVTLCEDGKTAVDLIRKRDFDLYLIDINIPYINGIELVKFIKEQNKTGFIIMITAAVEEENFEKAYGYGCDDYIKKPFHAAELEMRIKHLLKESVKFDDYEFNFHSGDLFKNGERVNLRKKEKRLLHILLKNLNYTVYNDKIIDFVWEGENKKNYPLRQLVNELRKKFDKDYIKTVVGVGYRFEV